MSDEGDTLQVIAGDVAAARARLQHLWPTPEDLVAAKFAVTEAGEARLELLLDALLLAFSNTKGDLTLPLVQRAFVAATRALDHGELRGGEFNRNTPRAPNFRREVADLAMMCATALGPDFPYRNDAQAREVVECYFPHGHHYSHFMALVSLTTWGCLTLEQVSQVSSVGKAFLSQALCFCLDIVPDLREAVQERLARIERRVLVATLPTEGAHETPR